MYGYVVNDPINWIDPLGLRSPSKQNWWYHNPYAYDPYYWAQQATKACREFSEKVTKMFSEADDSFDTDNPNTSNPFRGETGDVSQSNNSKGSKSQERLYGDDGYPDFDIDYDHSHGNSGMPHGHQWDRPADGSPPTNSNRGPGFPL